MNDVSFKLLLSFSEIKERETPGNLIIIAVEFD